jgi:hypothetical protein
MREANPLKEIAKMSPHELLMYILDSPELLTDSYFRDFRKAIYKRAIELGFYNGTY